MDYDESSGKKILTEQFAVSDFIAVKGYKAKGKRITTANVKTLTWLAPDPEPEPQPDESSVPDLQPTNLNEGFAEGTQTELF